jgi:hypothetical protein
MRKILLLAGTAVCLLGGPTFATPSTSDTVGQTVGTVQDGAIVLAQSSNSNGNGPGGDKANNPSNGCSLGNDNVVSRSKPCPSPPGRAGKTPNN